MRPKDRNGDLGVCALPGLAGLEGTAVLLIVALCGLALSSCPVLCDFVMPSFRDSPGFTELVEFGLCKLGAEEGRLNL